MNRAVAGALAGLTATAAMTWAMRRMHRRLPRRERYPLPPRLITERVFGPTGVMDRLDEPERRDLALTLHYGYGAATGALYPAVAKAVGGPPVVSGIGYGLAVWAASYLGWIPALRILRPATQHPAERVRLMLAAHVVWGAATGLVAGLLLEGKLRGEGVPERGGRLLSESGSQRQDSVMKKDKTDRTDQPAQENPGADAPASDVEDTTRTPGDGTLQGSTPAGLTVKELRERAEEADGSTQPGAG